MRPIRDADRSGRGRGIRLSVADVTQSIRQYWTGLRGRVPLNLNWGAIDHDSVVLVTASEYTVNAAAPQTSQRFVGAASITVANITPHGPPYDPNRGVTFVVHVDWGTPLNVVTDITVLSAKPSWIGVP